jgi:hypothetical protein
MLLKRQRAVVISGVMKWALLGLQVNTREIIVLSSVEQEIEQNPIKNEFGSSYKMSIFCHILSKIKLYGQILANSLI